MSASPPASKQILTEDVRAYFASQLDKGPDEYNLPKAEREKLSEARIQRIRARIVEMDLIRPGEEIHAAMSVLYPITDTEAASTAQLSPAQIAEGRRAAEALASWFHKTFPDHATSVAHRQREKTQCQDAFRVACLHGHNAIAQEAARASHCQDALRAACLHGVNAVMQEAARAVESGGLERMKIAENFGRVVEANEVPPVDPMTVINNIRPEDVPIAHDESDDDEMPRLERIPQN